MKQDTMVICTGECCRWVRGRFRWWPGGAGGRGLTVLQQEPPRTFQSQTYPGVGRLDTQPPLSQQPRLPAFLVSLEGGGRFRTLRKSRGGALRRQQESPRPSFTSLGGTTFLKRGRKRAAVLKVSKTISDEAFGRVLTVLCWTPGPARQEMPALQGVWAGRAGAWFGSQ